MAKKRLVVVGNGMAGARAVEDVLARGGADKFDIVVFGDEPYGNYNRILLSKVLSREQSESDIFLNDFNWYSANNIKLYSGERIVKIDRAEKKVHSNKNTVENYDVLLIATGSRAFVPPVEGMTIDNGALHPDVFVFRNIDDCHSITKAASNGKKIAIIGGGLLGLEAAYGLLKYGCEVHVVHRGKRLMDRQLDDVSAGLLKKTMEGMGVNVHLNKTTTAVSTKSNKASGLQFKDGGELSCDLVIVAAGIRPNSELGLQANLSVERAIIVDDQMRSPDDDNVFIVGECAQHRGQVYGLVAPLWEQAAIFADCVTGKNSNAVYQGSKVSTKLKVMGVDVASMGIVDAEHERDEVVQYSELSRGTYKKLIIRDGRLVGAIMMGDLGKMAFLQQAFDRGSLLPEDRASLLFNIGGSNPEVSVAEMAADAQICNCNCVSKGTIGEAVATGCRTAQEVGLKTRAGMGCGSCKPLVAELVEWFSDENNKKPEKNSSLG